MNQFKRAQVIMLPTNKKPDKGCLLVRHIWKADPKLECNSLWQYDKTINIGNIKQYTTLNGSFRDWYKSFEPQHLYIISDDEIKEDNYAYYKLDGKVIKITKDIIDGDIKRFGYKKIIATTDTSLTIETRCTYDANDVDIFTLPQPSQQFIKKYIESYNKGEVITDVLVEYERYEMESKANHKGNYDYRCPNCNKGIDDLMFSKQPTYCNNCSKLKVNPKDNTITIKKIKDSWNKEEINTLFHEFADYIQPNTEEDHIQYNKWIDKNL